MQSTCLKWSPKGSLKIGCLRQVTPQYRFIFTEFWFKGPEKRWLLKAGDPLIEVTTAGMTVCVCFQGNATLPISFLPPFSTVINQLLKEIICHRSNFFPLTHFILVDSSTVMLNKSVCHFRGVGSVLLLLFNF